jgi:hypothetical protein
MFDLETEIQIATLEALAVPQPVGPQAIPTDSPLYQSLLADFDDKYEYVEERERLSDEDLDRKLDERERVRDMRGAK